MHYYAITDQWNKLSAHMRLIDGLDKSSSILIPDQY